MLKIYSKKKFSFPHLQKLNASPNNIPEHDSSVSWPVNVRCDYVKQWLFIINVYYTIKSYAKVKEFKNEDSWSCNILSSAVKCLIDKFEKTGLIQCIRWRKKESGDPQEAEQNHTADQSHSHPFPAVI